MKGMKVRKSCEDFIKLEKAAQQNGVLYYYK